MLQRTYRYRLYPTRRQREALDQQLSFACDLYNTALEQRRFAYRYLGVSLNYNAQAGELTELRRKAPELLPPAGMNCWSQQQVLRRLDRAFSAFFRRLARKEKPGYPRFKSKARFSTLAFSFAGNAGGVALTDKDRLYLQGVGHVKVKWHRRLPANATVGELRITRRGEGPKARYYAAFSLELPSGNRAHRSGEAVGIDVGVRSFATLSTGESLAGPRAGKENARRVRQAARRVARRMRGSNRRHKAAACLARAREREANRRRDNAHRESRELADRFALIAHEDLRIKNMTRSAKGTLDEPGRGVRQKAGLNREIADQGWGMFFSMLAYKAEEAGGRVVKVDPAHTSRTCAACGHADAGSRKSRRFCCTACGHTDDADVNAAKVILARGLQAAGEESDGPGRGLRDVTWPDTASVSREAVAEAVCFS